MGRPMLRRTRPEDAEHVCALIAAAFPDNPKRHLDVLRWQYWRNPFGPAQSWVAEDQGRIVGHYAAVPYAAILGGQPGRITVGSDAAVAASHRGAGIFTALTRAVHADCARNGIPATVCYPNPKSLRGLTAGGWRQIEPLRLFVLASGALAGAVSRGPTQAGGLEVAEPPADLDEVWGKLAAEVRYGVVRDLRWFRWRYRDRPGAGAYRFFEARRDGEPAGVAVTCTRTLAGRRFAGLLELLAVDVAAARALVASIRSSVEDVDGIVAPALPASRQAELLAASGFRRLPRLLEPRRVLFGLVDTGGDRPDLFQGPWALGWGDLDHL